MKFPIISTVIVTLLAMIGMAQADVHIASVNVRELYTMYYKRFETENKLQQRLAEIKEEVRVREERLRALQEEDRQINEKYDSSLPQATIEKLRSEHNAKMNEIKAADQELKDFVQRRAMAFREYRNREMRLLLEDVQNSINAVAEAQHADLVIDSSTVSAQQDIGIATSAFPYINKGYDITPEVLQHLNAGAPAGFNPEEELKRLYGSQQEAPEAPAAQ